MQLLFKNIIIGLNCGLLKCLYLYSEHDLESNHVVKKRYSHSNDNGTNCNYKYVNTKGFVKKRDNSDNKTKSRILPVICEPEEKPMDQFLEELCTNLHEHNSTLMCKLCKYIWL